MAIKVRCSYCGRENKVPQSSGGSWGSCLGCKNRLYFPSADSGDSLRLKPVNKREQARKKALLDEEFKLRQAILLERNIYNDNSNMPKETLPENIGFINEDS
ncbi:MAG: hypothetical protein ACYTBV_13735 [Planctomycetota bacterium]|jgi:hypothetical protein